MPNIDTCPSCKANRTALRKSLAEESALLQTKSGFYHYRETDNHKKARRLVGACADCLQNVAPCPIGLARTHCQSCDFLVGDECFYRHKIKDFEAWEQAAKNPILP